jgi:hypothetical protein
MSRNLNEMSFFGPIDFFRGADLGGSKKSDFGLFLASFCDSSSCPGGSFLADRGLLEPLFSGPQIVFLYVLYHYKPYFVISDDFLCFQLIFDQLWLIFDQPTAFCPSRRSPTSDSIIRREVRPTNLPRASSQTSDSVTAVPVCTY